MKTYKKVWSAAVWLIAVLIVWEAAAYLLEHVLHDPLAAKKVPGLPEIGAAFVQYGAGLLRQAGITVSYAGAGFVIGAAVGIVLALVMSLSGVCDKMILPYLLAAQMIPVLGLAPIIFGLFKDIAVSRVVIAAYITFFPVSVNLLSGLKSAEENLTAMMRASAAGKRQLYQKLLIPHAAEHLFTGLKIAAPMAVTAAVLVDTLSAKDGIGYVIVLTLYGGGTTGQFWPAIVIAALLGLFSFFIISAAEYILVPWKRQPKGAGT